MPTGPITTQSGGFGPPSVGSPGGFKSTQPVYAGAGSATSGDGSGVVDTIAHLGGAVGGWILDHWEDLTKLGIGAYTTKEAIQNAQKSDALTNAALSGAAQDYADRGKYRDAAASKLGATRPNLSGIFQDPGNPYKSIDRSIPVVGGGIPSGLPPVDTTKTGSQLWRTPAPTLPPVDVTKPISQLWRTPPGVSTAPTGPAAPAPGGYGHPYPPSALPRPNRIPTVGSY